MNPKATTSGPCRISTPENIVFGQKFFLWLLCAFVFVLVSFFRGFSINKTFTGAGNFGTATNWSGATLPAAGDNLTISGTCTVDNNALTDNVAYGTLTIAGTLQWASGGTNRLNVGNINSTLAGSTIDMTNGGTLIETGTWNSTNLIFIPGTGTIELKSNTTLPTAYTTYNNLIINGGLITVFLGVNTTVNGNLTIIAGIFTVGANSLAVAGTTNISNSIVFTLTSATGTKSFGNLVINGTFINNVANVPIDINGNFQNNGIYTGGTGMVTFTGATSSTISGTATSTAFGGGITVNKGVSNANVLDVQSIITLPSGGLTLTNGTLKLSSNSTITPFTTDIAAAPYRIPVTAGLWINGGTVSTTSSITVAGLIRVSNGTFNVGDAADECLMSSWATITVEGGVFNIAGRLMGRIATEGSYLTMTSGTLTVPTIGSTSNVNSPFHLDNAASSFTMSGGTIVLQRGGGNFLGYLNLAGISNVTGGTLQVGNTVTPSSQTILINSNVPIFNFTLNGSNSPTAQLTTNSLTVNSNVTLTSGTLNANNLNLIVGGNWSRASTASFTPGTGTVTFNGSVAQSINGTATSQTFNNIVVAKVAGSILNAGGSTTSLTTNNFTQTTGDFIAPATININATATSSLLLTSGMFTAGAIINVTGDWSNNGGTFIPGLNTVSFNGSGAQAVKGTAATQTFYNIIIALTAGQTLSVSGSTTTLTVQDFTGTSGNFTAGTAATVNINGNLTITAGTYTPGLNTNIAGNFSNAGTYTAAIGKTLTFTGASATAVTGAGIFTIFNLSMNKAAKTTVVDIQSSNFITGINSGNVYNFTFTQGTWKYNTTATLTDCHNNGIANALTIPFNVVIESVAGTMNLCRGGINGAVLLSGKLFVNGGIVRVMYAQAINAGLDFKYKVSGGTPQLYLANGGDLLLGAGFNPNAATDYIDFNMSGGGSIIHLADVGYSLAATFKLNNVVGGSTVMTGGTIAIENACNAAQPDIDMGGGNISPYTVTGGTIRFGWLGTQAGATFFGVQYYSSTNYPHLDFQSGIAKTVSPWASDGQTLNVLSIYINSNMTLDLTPATPDPNLVFLSNNGTFALSIAGNFLIGTGGVTFKGNGVNQLITGTGASYNFNNMTINMTPGNTTTVGGALTTLNVLNFTQTQGNYSAPAIFNVSGNWLHDAGTFTPGTNLVNFIGTGTKTLGGSSTTTFYNLTINPVAPADKVQLTNNAAVTSVLNLTKGVLDLNGRWLTITDGLSGAISRTAGYILSEKTDNSSRVRWNIGSNLTSHTFPFGTASAAYIPFILNLTAGDIGIVSVSTYPTAPNNTPYPSTPVSVTNMYASGGGDNSANAVDRFWQIDKEGVSGTATLTFTATSAEVGAMMLPTAQRWRSVPAGWEAPLPGQTSTSTSATVPGVTTFSPWTMSSQAALLPIQLVSFDAVYNNPYVLLTWSTETEMNSDYFAIERTTNESSFETVCHVKAAGESMQKLTYQSRDPNPLPGLSYYRLKQSDKDGKISYSDLVAIKITTADQISVAPNPVMNGMITIQVPNHPGETLEVSIIDMSANIPFAHEYKLDDSQQSSIVIDGLGDLPRGIYVLRISCTSEVFNKKITIY